MTYPNNPRPDPFRKVNNETGVWIAGIVGLCLVLGLVFWAANRSADTALTDRPTATTTATTTGSGASTIPANPNATTPQKDTSKPAPAPAPAAR